jgi:dsRNA-specific ribonuclease
MRGRLSDSAVDGEPLGYGTGKRKGHAHDMAAKKALETLEQRV